jgi:hypothetical protein
MVVAVLAIFLLGQRRGLGVWQRQAVPQTVGAAWHR